MHSSTVILLLPSLSSNAEGIIEDVGADETEGNGIVGGGEAQATAGNVVKGVDKGDTEQHAVTPT